MMTGRKHGLAVREQAAGSRNAPSARNVRSAHSACASAGDHELAGVRAQDSPL
jgi:hypothetical protein